MGTEQGTLELSIDSEWEETEDGGYLGTYANDDEDDGDEFYEENILVLLSPIDNRATGGQLCYGIYTDSNPSAIVGEEAYRRILHIGPQSMHERLRGEIDRLSSHAQNWGCPFYLKDDAFND